MFGAPFFEWPVKCFRPRDWNKTSNDQHRKLFRKQKSIVCRLMKTHHVDFLFVFFPLCSFCSICWLLVFLEAILNIYLTTDRVIGFCTFRFTISHWPQRAPIFSFSFSIITKQIPLFGLLGLCVWLSVGKNSTKCSVIYSNKLFTFCDKIPNIDVSKVAI